MDEEVGGWIGECMDGWIGRWMDRWMDEWLDEQTCWEGLYF